jgi:ketosteroid isomerase-like protein
MALRATVLALPALALGAAAGAASDGAGPDGTREVLEVVREWNRAFARNDVDTYFSYIDAGVTVITPSSPYRVEGIGDDRAIFERDLKSGRGRVGFFREMQPLVQRFGDLAVVTYYSRGDYGPESADRTLHYKETDVLLKREGRWRIVHIHVSATP